MSTLTPGTSQYSSLETHESGRWQIRDHICAEGSLIVIRRQWKYHGARQAWVKLGLDLRCHFRELDYWMLPGLMYNGNPGARCQLSGMLNGGEPWCFREERTTVPWCMILEPRGDVLGAFPEPAEHEDHLSFCSLISDADGYVLRIGFPFVPSPM